MTVGFVTSVQCNSPADVTCRGTLMLCMEETYRSVVEGGVDLGVVQGVLHGGAAPALGHARGHLHQGHALAETLTHREVDGHFLQRVGGWRGLAGRAA